MFLTGGGIPNLSFIVSEVTVIVAINFYIDLTVGFYSLYFIYRYVYFRFECYREWNLGEGVAKEFAGILAYKQSLVPYRSRNIGLVRCRGTNFYGRVP